LDPGEGAGEILVVVGALVVGVEHLLQQLDSLVVVLRLDGGIGFGGQLFGSQRAEGAAGLL
jgi:hypothetical protein